MTKRQKIENVISKLLDTNIALMDFYKTIAPNEDAKKVCDKSIRQSKKAQKILTSINHDEIVYSLYNSIFTGKEGLFVVASSLICSKRLKTWDTTEKGFQEFLMLEKQGKEEEQAEIDKKKQEQLAIQKAREEGKKVEYVYDPKEKRTKQVILENKAN